MRILSVSNYYKPAYCYGGPVRSLSTMLEGLVSVGAEVTVFTTNANCGNSLNVPLSTPVEMDGVRVHYFPLTFSMPYQYSRSMKQKLICRISEFDIVMTSSVWAWELQVVADMCMSNGIPFVVSPRGQLLPWAMRYKRWKKVIYWNLVARRKLNMASAFHCTSESEAIAIGELGLKPAAFVVPNSLDLERFSSMPSRGKMRRELGIPLSHIVLLMVGRLHKVKNPEVALQALIKVQRQDLHVIFVGPDEEGCHDHLMAIARQAGVRNQVHFAGLRTGSELLQAFADSDLFIMPSAMESFGMAALEALAAGVPILVSEHVPVGIWAQQLAVGRISACDPGEFASSIQEMLESPENLVSMGPRGRALVGRYFDSSTLSRQMLHELNSILTEGTSPSVLS